MKNLELAIWELAEASAKRTDIYSEEDFYKINEALKTTIDYCYRGNNET